MRGLLLIICFIIPTYTTVAQVLPREGAKLNYRIIGFSFPEEFAGRPATIEIAEGSFQSLDSFRTHILLTVECTGNKKIVEVPSFGKGYTWRVRTGKKQSQLFHFTTVMNAHVDTAANRRLRILQPAAPGYEDYYVSVDAGGVLYDMKGKPVWYVPDSCGNGGELQDLKFTPFGTVTFMNAGIFEATYDGRVLWRGPNTGKVTGNTSIGEFYHHEFTRLSNGHYMVLGMQVLLSKLENVNDSFYISLSDDKTQGESLSFGKYGVIIEYDQQGNPVWSWKFSDHLQGTDFAYYEALVDSYKRFDPHDNAFYVDEKKKVIYLGFRNLNRVMKIEYPGGKVLATYGDNFKPGMHSKGEHILCNQHSIGMTHDGNLYIFNNNSCRLVDSLPEVIVLREPSPGQEDVEVIRKYPCTVEGNYPKGFSKGGNAIELEDHSMFICMGSDYSKIFIVTDGNKISWSALPERLMMPDNKWVPIHEYRANIIRRADLEKMIWVSESLSGNGKK